jgi:hypothetical protein
MGKVLTHMTMSLDGYIADREDQPGELFDWFEAGEVSVPSGNETVTFDVDEASAAMLGDLTERAGALVSGRRLFDIANGWNDAHPAGMSVSTAWACRSWCGANRRLTPASAAA